MSFLYPVFLSALLLLIIPLLVHLFRFRKHRVVQFTRVSLLKEVEIETKNQNRLKHLITLICRMLALACLVLAFAIPTCNKLALQGTGKTRVSIFIDNSYSMDNGRDGQILLETAKQRAREIVKSYGINGTFQIRSLQSGGSSLRFVSAEEAVSNIDALKIRSGSNTLSSLLSDIADDLKQEGNSHAAFVISDFQSGFVDVPRKLPEINGLAVTFVKITAGARENISIDSAWLQKPYLIPGEKNTLQFRIANYTREPMVDFPVKFYTETGLAGTGRISVLPGTSAVSSIDFTAENKSFNPGKLVIEEPGATFDNVLYVNIASHVARNVGVSSSNRFLDNVIGAQPFLQKKPGAGPFSGQASSSGDVFLWVGPGSLSQTQAQTMKDWLNTNGATAIVAADADGNTEALQKVFGLPETKWVKESARISDKSFSHPFFAGVFQKLPRNMNVPEVKNYLSTSGSNGTGESILTLENGDPLLLKFQVGSGNLYFFTAPFSDDGGNLVKSPLFLPLITQAMIGGAAPPALYGICNSGKVLPLENLRKLTEKPPVLKTDGWEGVAEISPTGSGNGLYMGVQPEKAGNYRLLENGSNRLLAGVSVNDNRMESNPNMASEEVMKNWSDSNNISWMQGDNAIAAFQAKISDTAKWRLFIWLAAVFFALEVLVLVFWDSRFNKIEIRQSA
ncbi:MAG: BatA domain-containing protein [Sphingomonadales bacterium]|jgi:hypothetical protein